MLMAVLLVACGQDIDQEGQQDKPIETNDEIKTESESGAEDSLDESSVEDTDFDEPNTAQSSVKSLSDLKVHYIDAGQADAALLQYADDEEEYSILFDTGDWRGNEVVNYLTAQDISSLDLVVVSHPDADHIGQLAEVVTKFDPGEVWLSGNESSSETFQQAIEAVLSSDADYDEPRMGDVFEIGPMEIDVLYPESISGKANEESVSLKFTYGDISFVFTGDAETSGELEMIRSGIKLEADFLQLGHHGSDTSSDPAFIEAVNPTIAIYSAGADNSYGHPSPEVVSLMKEAGIKLYGTDVHGTIVVTTDGKEYSIATKENGTISPKSTGSSNTDTGSSNPEKSTVTGECININEASKEEVQGIIHIGPARAQELIERRPFESVDDLTRINGIGPARITDIKEEGLACTA
ncbi:MBL fold metallo-hydrolase [Oceanobacillus halophilus]|uniref:MBL fold metallo-hydrolase n=2 Tax=Oceanobacillus halophilus TaxID=930130 RepID=A0A495A802_9BACI|nr:MBL fold metallo-hydrolase [Oceanobacillus halophilus]